MSFCRVTTVEKLGRTGVGQKGEPPIPRLQPERTNTRRRVMTPGLDAERVCWPMTSASMDHVDTAGCRSLLDGRQGIRSPPWPLVKGCWTHAASRVGMTTCHIAALLVAVLLDVSVVLPHGTEVVLVSASRVLDTASGTRNRTGSLVSTMTG